MVFLLLFSRFSFCLLIVWSQHSDVWISLSSNHLEFSAFLRCGDQCFSPNLQSFQPLFLQKKTFMFPSLSFLPLRLFLCVCWYALCGCTVFWGYLNYSSFFFYLFLILEINSFSFCSKLLVSPSNKFFISLLVHFNSRISIRFFF